MQQASWPSTRRTILTIFVPHLCETMYNVVSLRRSVPRSPFWAGRDAQPQTSLGDAMILHNSSGRKRQADGKGPTQRRILCEARNAHA